jgi:hypothetical protein
VVVISPPKVVMTEEVKILLYDAPFSELFAVARTDSGVFQNGSLPVVAYFNALAPTSWLNYQPEPLPQRPEDISGETGDEIYINLSAIPPEVQTIWVAAFDDELDDDGSTHRHPLRACEYHVSVKGKPQVMKLSNVNVITLRRSPAGWLLQMDQEEIRDLDQFLD